MSSMEKYYETELPAIYRLRQEILAQASPEKPQESREKIKFKRFILLRENGDLPKWDCRLTREENATLLDWSTSAVLLSLPFMDGERRSIIYDFCGDLCYCDSTIMKVETLRQALSQAGEIYLDEFLDAVVKRAQKNMTERKRKNYFETEFLRLAKKVALDMSEPWCKRLPFDAYLNPKVSFSTLELMQKNEGCYEMFLQLKEFLKATKIKFDRLIHVGRVPVLCDFAIDILVATKGDEIVCFIEDDWREVYNGIEYLGAKRCESWLYVCSAAEYIDIFNRGVRVEFESYCMVEGIDASDCVPIGERILGLTQKVDRIK